MREHKKKPQERSDHEKNHEKRSFERKPKISRVKEREAEDFLIHSMLGQRQLAAERTLTNLIKGKLPLIEQFIFNGVFDFREINDSEEFKSIIKTNPDYERLFSVSNSGGYVRVYFDKSKLSISLFYEKIKSKNDAALYAKNFSEVIAITYAALGLDMTGLSQSSFSKQKNFIENEVATLLETEKSE